MNKVNNKKMKIYKAELSQACLESVIIVCPYDELENALHVYSGEFTFPIEKICLVDYETNRIKEYKGYFVGDVKNNYSAPNLAVFLPDLFPQYHWYNEFSLHSSRNSCGITYYYYKGIRTVENSSMKTFPTENYLDRKN